MLIALTTKFDRRVREYAHVLQHKTLLGKLSEGDMHALDARYHLSCMTFLSNRVRKYQIENVKDHQKSTTSSLVLTELVVYIEDFRAQNNDRFFNYLN